MRRRSVLRQKKKRRLQVGWLSTFLYRIGLTVVAVSCVAYMVATRSSIAEKELQLNALQQKQYEVSAENAKLSEILDSGNLDSGNMDAYMEKLAIEERNYAYPGERRYYDTSRD